MLNLYVPTIFIFLKRVWVAVKVYSQDKSDQDGCTDDATRKANMAVMTNDNYTLTRLCADAYFDLQPQQPRAANEVAAQGQLRSYLARRRQPAMARVRHARVLEAAKGPLGGGALSLQCVPRAAGRVG
jgi:hypothetical protein